MDYVLMICSDGIATPEKVAALQAQIPGWIEEMDGRGVRLYGHTLAEPHKAKTVTVRGGQTLVTDGPFAETKEFIAGFDLLGCADLDEALEIAAKHPVAQFHSIEVRPFFPGPCGGSVPAGEALRAGPPAGRERYLMLMCLNGIAESDEEEAWVVQASTAWGERAAAAGISVFGDALAHADAATTVRVQSGETVLSDGPFAETKEFIGGLTVVDVTSMDEAITLAAQHPLAVYHRVEVRPFAEDTRES